MPWSLPLGAIASMAHFSSKPIRSDNHFQFTTDTYSELWPWRSYRTSPHTPPHMNISRYDQHLADGYIFMTPYDDKQRDGVKEEGTGFVMTVDGDLVFTPPASFDGFCGDWISGMTDLRTQDYRGRKYMTYWNGCNTHGAHWGHRWGRVTFVDQEYNNFTINPNLKMNTLDDANRGQIDVHEHEMTDDNTMMVTSYNNTPCDLRPINGKKDSWVVDSCFFEVDIETEEVLFQWCALDHVPLKDTKYQRDHPRGSERQPYDYFHINAVQKIGKNYLISSRHHFAAYMISGEDGSVMWKLDGSNGGDFGSIPQHFMLQHHVRAQNITEDGMTITLLNNHGPASTQALGFWIPLPPNRKNPPVLVRRLEVVKDVVHAGTQGSYQIDIGDGHGFVGYGKIALAREFGKVEDGEINGKLLWEGRFGYNGAAMSYRVFKMPWHATPKDWDPSLLIEQTRLQRRRFTKVFVSWNGATDIESWAVFAGRDQDSMKSVGVAKKHGFETVLHLENAMCVQLGAMQNGKIIRASNLACLDPEDVYHEETGVLDDILQDEYEPGADDGNDFIHETLSSDIDELQSEKEELEAEKADLKAETTKLQAQMDELEDELQDVKSGAWFSYRLFAEIACGLIVLVAVIWGYILIRDRRRPRFEDEKSEPSSLGLGTPRLNVKRVRAPEIRIHHASSSSVDEAQLKIRDQEMYGFVEDDDDDHGAMSSRATARTPFLRQTSGI